MALLRGARALRRHPWRGARVMSEQVRVLSAHGHYGLTRTCGRPVLPSKVHGPRALVEVPEPTDFSPILSFVARSRPRSTALGSNCENSDIPLISSPIINS